jgi:2-polyprenyl-3-methyl-5-hydroxy-6-metoxy-1,4-benzoquinol methylase
MSNSIKNASRHYLGDEGAKYEQIQHPNLNSPRYPYEFSFFKPYIKEEDTVLDFGCSNGGILRYSKQHAQNSFGLEVNEYAANLARAQGLTVFDNLESLSKNLFFDVIYSNHVLEHIPNVASTLEQIRSKIKNNGKLLLKLPMDDWRAKEQKQWNSEDINHHLYAWTPLTLGNLLLETGFRVESIRILTFAYHPKLDPLVRIRLHPLAYWALATFRNRRQLFAIAYNPGED